MVRPTIYEVETANRVLPLVRSIVRDVVEEFHVLRGVGREQRALEAEAGGNPEQRAHLQKLREALSMHSSRIEGYLRELEELGIELRDLETGLVDFPTLVGGEPAYLCWKPGEGAVAWWHAATTGFADRRPIAHGAPADLPR